MIKLELDVTELTRELRVIREELRAIKTMLAERMPLVIGKADALPVRVLTQKQVLAMVPFGYVRLKQMRRAGLFPRAVRFGIKRDGFIEQEVLDWIETQKRSANGSAFR